MNDVKIKNIRIGVIGAGHMGRNHIRNLTNDYRFQFVGIYDNSEEAMSNTSRDYGVEAYNSMEELLKNVDAVVVAVPSSLHKEVGLVVASYGVHALIEKPLALNSKEAKEIVDAFEKKNLKLAVGHVERYNSAYRELKKIVLSQEPYYIEACRYSPYVNSGRIKDTSVIEDLMIHDVDLVCDLMSRKKLTSIHGRGECILSDKPDFASCLLDFDGESHAIVNASRVAQEKERSITVHTKEGCIHADLLSKSISISQCTNMFFDSSKEYHYIQDGVVRKIFVPITEPLKEELLAFYNAIVNDTEIEVNGKVGVEAIRICETVANRVEKRNEYNKS